MDSSKDKGCTMAIDAFEVHRERGREREQDVFDKIKL